MDSQLPSGAQWQAAIFYDRAVFVCLSRVGLSNLNALMAMRVHLM